MVWYCIDKNVFLTPAMFTLPTIGLGEGDINEVLIKTLAEAHANTNLKLDTVNEMLRKGVVCIYKLSLDSTPINWQYDFFPEGSRPRTMLQDDEPAWSVVGLLGETDRNDSKYYWIRQTYSRIYAAQSRRSGK